MDDTYFTIGMAGHIDHGKTTLTKALSNVDTDRLKEEKERSISIELGYAPLQIAAGVNLSIVDVPGHERFIRQMIAGVAGIDLVVLVIAADEGVMPQTKEHLEILEFLGVEHCIVAISKIDRVDDELLELVTEDIKEGLAGTIFHEAPFVYVDGVSGKGIDNLKQTLLSELESVESRDAYGSFRLPVDQVFTVQGQGTIVRGTIYEGVVQKGSHLRLLPNDYKVRARQIQVHHKDQEQALAGQRTAVNLGGIAREDISRGDVLVASDHFLVTEKIDVSLRFVDELTTPVKQRMPVKIHVGTSEVMGRIVFFDRNEVNKTSEEVLCQIQLNEEVVVRRGDRFILRRPTPIETIGEAG
ncbi:selenocysteine-specific translation elongation factor [Halobacillus shinanisalinarum]|uniref:selenocysteine-specific translation elongation factor n=1 Tax=Halobacillus shinanisalinarum TaxID=2932258 RepID=UPI0029622A0C|nr:selenocysteine-specific translation elongation factor [Halobacillus shinanisalinarum]